MSEHDREREWIARARAQLERDAESLDETTRARLRAARLRSLDALAAPRRAPGGLLAASAGLVALLLLVSSWLGRHRRDPPLGDALDDVEILSATDDLELYDDLDFYRWLADEQSI